MTEIKTGTADIQVPCADIVRGFWLVDLETGITVQQRALWPRLALRREDTPLRQRQQQLFEALDGSAA